MYTISKRLFIVVMLLVTQSYFYTQTEKYRLADYSFNNCSQYGEDGIIKKIFEIIGTRSKACIEVGVDIDQVFINIVLNQTVYFNTSRAKDGIYYSNTANLWLNDKTWKGVIFEERESHCSVITQLNQPNCYLLQESSTAENIERVLQKKGITKQLDLLVINKKDTYIFENLTLEPRVVVQEYDHLQPDSLSMLLTLAHKKGYKLVEFVHNKAFFVPRNLYRHFNKMALPNIPLKLSE